MKKYKKVLIGLDLGTDSVGWCVTDENSHIIKKNGKSLWGYRGFDEAKAAKDRRLAREQRRRYNRRQERIRLLRDIFKNEIEKVDDSFYYRLDNSFFKNEDREKKFDYTLFNSLNYTDSQYYEKYPTIYHLRKHLVYSKEKEDIRLIYLAMHHMIKYRGNFLNDMDEFHAMDEKEGNEYFEELQSNLSDLVNNEDEEDIIEFNNIEYSNDIFNRLKALNQEHIGISVLKEKYGEILNPNKNKYIKDFIIPLMVGGEVAISKSGLKNIDDDKKKAKLCVKKEDYDQIVSELSDSNPTQESIISLLMQCKHIYEFFLLGKLIGKHQYLCDAMVDAYNEHHSQLIKLKNYVKKNYPNKYDEIFRIADDKINNYVKYVGSTIVEGKKVTLGHSSQDDFYKYLKETLELKDYKGNDKYLKEILTLMENGEYLVRQNSSNNSVYPYQLHKLEMKIILNNQSKYYPFLLEKEDGLSNINKIISILEFKIPYYIGPLISHQEGCKRSKFSWVVRTNEKITPWNINRVVNFDESAKNFINRMLTKCSYLNSCYCMTKNSLLFSYFNTLMNLNKLNVNGTNLDYETKMDIINSLFKKQRKVTKNDIVKYFKAKTGETVILSTANGKELKEFDCDMSSYVDFVKILGEEYVNKNQELIENIIRDIVIFEDKSILVKRLNTEYGIVNEKVIKQIKGLNYSKYASISKELLTDILYYDKNEQTGEVYSSETILSVMEKENKNLQEVLNDERYHFIDLINEYNKKNSPVDKVNSIEDYVSNLGFVSPGMKRPMIQAYKICEEVEKILGQRIDEYYVECTRTNKEKKEQSKTRQQKLIDMYNEAIKTATGEYKKQLEQFKKEVNEKDANLFRSDKYYLYFTQLGKCMYTGEPIDISQLNDDDMYNIDHIYPQSLIKDDSLSNRVLVTTKANEQKADNYPISQSILWKGNYKQAYAFYKQLKDSKLISEEKYNRLVKLELTESELESFVNRQLVYTNQAVKGFINAIKQLKTTDDFTPKIVYAKGENVSDFRKKYDVVKSRNVNNFHHAHDAYLNIVVGRTIDYYFGYYQMKYGNTNYLKWMHDNGYTTNVMKIFDQNEKKLKHDIISKDGIIWSYDNSLKEIKHNVYDRFDIFSTERTYIGNTLFEKVTILPAGKGGNIPVKNSGPYCDNDKYGGFKQYAFGFYSLIKVGDDYILEAIPTLYKNDIFNFICSKYKNFDIIIPIVKINTILYFGKIKFSITGKSDVRFLIKNRNERIFDEKTIHIIKKVEKLNERYCAKVNGKESIKIIENYGFIFDGDSLIIAQAKNKNSNSIIISNDELLYVYKVLLKLFEKNIYSFPCISSLKNTLENKENIFNDLSIVGKNYIIFQLLELLKCNERKSIDLSLLGESSNFGTIRISSKLKSCKLVAESITGYYTKTLFEIK